MIALLRKRSYYIRVEVCRDNRLGLIVSMRRLSFCNLRLKSYLCSTPAGKGWHKN